MALLGTYVGVIPVLLGMLWLPLLRRSKPGVIRMLMAFTIGLLIFLIVDALLEGTEVAGQGSQAFGGSLLVYLGAIVGYLTLPAVDVFMRSRGEAASGKAAGRPLPRAARGDRHRPPQPRRRPRDRRRLRGRRARARARCS